MAHLDATEMRQLMRQRLLLELIAAAATGQAESIMSQHSAMYFI